MSDEACTHLDEINELKTQLELKVEKETELQKKIQELKTSTESMRITHDTSKKELENKLEEECNSKREIESTLEATVEKLNNTSTELTVLRENFDSQKKSLNTLLLEKIDQSAENGWSRANIETVNLWKRTCSETVFVYETFLTRHRKTLDNISLSNFILTLFSATISFAYLGVNDSAYPNVSIGLKITFVILSILVCILSGTIKLYDFSGVISRTNSYIEKVDCLLSNLINETTLPVDLREHGTNVIKKNKDMYFEILKSPPELGVPEYNKLLTLYNKSIQDKVFLSRALRDHKIKTHDTIDVHALEIVTRD